MICDTCLKTTKDRVETVAKAAKGGAKLPAEGFTCSTCVQKLLYSHAKGSGEAQAERKGEGDGKG